MNTVTFRIPVILPTDHHSHEVHFSWLGRANLVPGIDHDDNDQPFETLEAEITDLWLHEESRPAETATRVGLPDGSFKGQFFSAKLRNAAIMAHHKPGLEPAQMPDEL